MTTSGAGPTKPYTVMEWAKIHESVEDPRAAKAMLMRGEDIVADFHDADEARKACAALNAVSGRPEGGGASLRPWTLHDDERGSDILGATEPAGVPDAAHDIGIYGPRARVVARVGGSDAEGRANARLIVSACNATPVSAAGTGEPVTWHQVECAIADYAGVWSARGEYECTEAQRRKAYESLKRAILGVAAPLVPPPSPGGEREAFKVWCRKKGWFPEANPKLKPRVDAMREGWLAHAEQTALAGRAGGGKF